MLQTCLQLESNKDTIKINYENLEKEQMNDEVISPVFMQFNRVNSSKRQSFEEQKLFCKKTKPF